MDKDGLIDAKVDASVLFLNGRVEGSSGLGMWVGTYTLSGDNLTFDAGNLYAGAFTEEQSEQG
jgi:heat shock protein HslJ